MSETKITATEEITKETPVNEEVKAPETKKTSRTRGASRSASKAEAKEPAKRTGRRATTRKTSAKKEADAKNEPAKKETAARRTTTRRTSAKKAEVTEVVKLEFSGKSYTHEDLIKICKDVWTYDLNGKEEDLKSIELYVKPEENVTYYVINGDVKGSFSI